jgi:microcystin-dependent protein
MAKKRRTRRQISSTRLRKIRGLKKVRRVPVSIVVRPVVKPKEDEEEPDNNTGTGGTSGSGSSTGTGSSPSSTSSSTTQSSNSGGMEGMIGEVRMFAGNFAPRNWALCEGQLLPISENTALFSILGTTYGGDGRTTFALPDLRGRVPIQHGQGQGLSAYNLGQKGGHEEITLTNLNMPSHNHQATIPATDNADELGNEDAAQKVKSNSPDVLNATTQNSGGNQPIGIVQPYLSLNFIICLYGIFPSRS